MPRLCCLLLLSLLSLAASASVSLSEQERAWVAGAASIHAELQRLDDALAERIELTLPED